MKKNIICIILLTIVLLVGTFIFYKYKKNNLENIKTNFYSTPVITLLGKDTIEICPKEVYIEQGFSATDKNDGDITNKVKKINKSNEILYYVENSKKITSSVKRKLVRKDNEAPKIELLGNQKMTIYLGNNYIEPGFKATDNCDGNLSNKVKVSEKLDTNKEGNYIISYKVQDSSGNEEILYRYIEVLKEPNKNIKTIYLTFDDGPSNITEQILDILKEENVKASFFVINADDKYNKYIKREIEEGHTLGLHSYTHKYKTIYHSKEAYFNDLNLIEEKITKITGVKPKIIRFPGGSSNTISKKGLMKTLIKEVEKKDYIYFDWNIASYDTSNISSNTIYNKVVSQLKKYNYSHNVILMHDFANNKKTVKALKKIIEYGKKEGYKFDKLSEWMPPIKHNIKN